jgi:hypothetical protein
MAGYKTDIMNIYLKINVEPWKHFILLGYYKGENYETKFNSRMPIDL